ncbi:MAG: type II toxin-antitoxin system RelE/ParE family toxin [Mastigocoleus sp.]
MTLRIFITPKASVDIDNLFNYIAQNNTDAALKFFDVTRNTIANLAKNPGLGSVYSVNSPRLQGLRKWGIKGFEKNLIFYLQSEELLTVVRIIHASRDIPTILEEESY